MKEETSKIEEMKFKVIDESGKEIECTGLFSFESAENGKNYLVYTDNSQDNDGNTRVYAAIYNPEVEEGMLKPIDSEAELELVQAMIEEFQKEEFEKGVES